MAARAVYVLCALTSLGCAVLLVRGYLESRARLLLWSSVSFVGPTFGRAIFGVAA